MRTTNLFSRLGAMLLACALLLVVATESSHAAGTTAGTQITSTATVNYLAGTDARSASNSVSVYVAQKIVINFTPASTSAGTSVDGTTIYRSFTVKNDGNYDDNFQLLAQSVPTNWTVTIYHDLGTPGAYDAGTDLVSASSGTLAVNGTYPVIVAITIPHNNTDAVDGTTYSPVIKVTSQAVNNPVSDPNVVVANLNHYENYTANVTINKPVIVFSATTSSVAANADRIPGAHVTYSLTLDNQSGSLTGISTPAATVTFVLDPHFQYVSSTNSGSLSGADGSGNGGTVTWTFSQAQLAAAASAILFDVMVMPEQITNNGTGVAATTNVYALDAGHSTTTQVHYNDGVNVYNQNNANNFTFAVGTASGALWAATPANSVGSPGQTVEYTYTLKNTGNHTDNYTFSNTPAGTVYGLSEGALGSLITTLTSPLTAGASIVLYVRTTIPANAQNTNTIIRDIVMTTTTSTPTAPTGGSISATHTLTTTVQAPSLSVAIAIESVVGTGTAANPAPGDVVTFKITLSNTGLADATNVTVSNPIDSHMTFAPDSYASGYGITIDGVNKTNASDTDGAYFDGSIKTDATTIPASQTVIIRYKTTVN